MDEIECEGVQVQPARLFVFFQVGRDASVVFFVSKDWGSHILHVYPYLVFTSGFKLKFHKAFAGLWIAFQYFVVGDGKLSAVVFRGGVHYVCAVLFQPASDCPLNGVCWLLVASVHNCHIFSFGNYFIPIVLEGTFDLFTFGKYHQAAGFSVQPVYYEDPWLWGIPSPLWCSVPDIVVEQRVCGYLFLSSGGSHREQSLTFLNNNYILVFVDNSDRYVFHSQFSGLCSVEEMNSSTSPS